MGLKYGRNISNDDFLLSLVMPLIMILMVVVTFLGGVLLVAKAMLLTKKGERAYKGDYKQLEYRILRERAYKNMITGIIIMITAITLYFIYRQFY